MIEKESEKDIIIENINGEDLKKVLDSLPEMFVNKDLFLQIENSGYKFRVSRKIAELEKEMPKNKIIAALKFITQYIYSQINFKEENFLETLQDEDPKEVKEFIEIINNHVNSKLIAFRVVRGNKFELQHLKISKRKIYGESFKELSYYNLRIPSSEGEFHSESIVFELDEIEIRTLIAALTKIINE